MTSDGYSNYRQWKGWSAGEFGECDTAQSLYFAAELARAGFTNLHGVKVLEIGFGDGRFAAWARAQGANYVGTEAISAMVDQGKRCGYLMYEADQPISSFVPASSLDMAISIDVFEHIDPTDLKQLLASLHVALRSGGCVFARVPSGDSPFARAIQYGDLTHRTVLGSSAVHQLAREAGFTVSAIREPTIPMRGLGALIWIRRFVVVMIRRITYPLIANALMGGGNPILSPNMVFVLIKD